MLLISNKEYILKWIEKSKYEEDAFDKFVYGFFALNAMYSIYYEGDERRAIRALLYACADKHKNEFYDIFDTNEYQYFCDRPPIKNCKFNPRTDRMDRADTRRDRDKLIEYSLISSNGAMLMILYQIRCNLFHGNKSFSDSNDQEIMKNAAELLLQYNLIFSKDLI